MGLDRALLVTLPFLAAAPAPVMGSDWPHLRGPGQDGFVASSVFETSGFGLEVAWKRTIGSGYSGVAVADGTAVTMSSDGENDVVVAFDAESGAPRWRQTLGPTYGGHDGSADGPLSTPLIDGETVYALSPRGKLVALDRISGAPRWSRDLVNDFEAAEPTYGFTTSPVAVDGLIIVQVGGPNGRSLVALETRTGEMRWAAGDEEVGYQSPVVMSLAGRRQVVAFRGSSVLVGHDPATGRLLWEHQLGERDHAGSAIPAPLGDDRFCAAVSSGLVIFELRRVDDGYEIEEVMRSRELGNTYAPPVRSGDYFYGFRRDFLTCVDARTGKRVWKSRPPGGKGLILVGEHLVIFGALGRVVVAAASPEGYREEASLQVFEGSWFTWPSFADDRIFLRNATELAAISVTDAGGGPAVASGADASIDSTFARFVRSLEQTSDPNARIEEFLAAQETMPIVEGNLVHFVYNGEADDVAIAASMIDSSRPDPLHEVDGTNLRYRTYRLEPGSRVEYQFQVDLERWEPDPLNPRTVPGRWGDQRLSEVLLPGYDRPRHLESPTTESRGRLETFAFRSDDLEGEREMTVYLPHGYDTTPDHAYPLLIVQDGTDWLERAGVVDALDNLIGRGVEPIVVVFLAPTDQWWLEAGGSETGAFVDVMAEQLVPELGRRYRLRTSSRDRALLATRDYALTAVYAAIDHPDVFGKVAVQSVGLRNGAQNEMMELLRQRPSQPLKFYVDWNLYEAKSIDQGFDFEADSQTLAAALERSGYSYVGGQVRDAHGWKSWVARLDRILEEFFPETR